MIFHFKKNNFTNSWDSWAVVAARAGTINFQYILLKLRIMIYISYAKECVCMPSAGVSASRYVDVCVRP